MMFLSFKYSGPPFFIISHINFILLSRVGLWSKIIFKVLQQFLPDFKKNVDTPSPNFTIFVIFVDFVNFGVFGVFGGGRLLGRFLDTFSRQGRLCPFSFLTFVELISL